MNLVSKEVKLYLIPAILFIVGIGLGFFAGNRTVTTQTPVEENTQSSNLYTVQSAVIRGKIDQINGNEITVTNPVNNISGTVKALDRVVITTLGKNQPTSDLSVLEVGKEVVIQLEMVDGTYQAVSIQYISPAPSLPPVMPGNDQ